MTDQQHPISIPPDLEEELLGLWPQEALQRAAQWGADMELKACCEFLEARHASFVSRDLRAARRPKPQSLAEEALLAIDTAVADDRLSPAVAHAVRRALERLQELERQSELTSTLTQQRTRLLIMTDNNNSGGIINISFADFRVEDTMAKAYRLGRRSGELVLQGCFQWTHGSDYGHEWRDIPIVDLNAAETL